ncbi:zinc metalloproteinase nas-12-like [Homalodisca vitripennis]|uniref:zinc metalloproteinase nas-12-like n=1 Tax=Homalodisca vitripennis TaxID=197043 RepID=UPI001EEB2647|nr:zinc metalloproteinase nas-12-like [Homalodisca vitripennis]
MVSYVYIVLGILMFKNFIHSSKGLFRNFTDIWLTNHIFYNVAPELPPHMVKAVKYSIEYLNQQTCIQWLQRDPVDTSVTEFVSFQYFYHEDPVDEGCESSVGWKRRGQQVILLGPKCMNDTVNGQRTSVLHEMMHTMGLNHEHQRYDRDCYIEVHKVFVSKFPNDLGIKPWPEYWTDWPYDFHSILHYQGGYFYPYDETIKKMGRTDGTLSKYDIERLEYLYCGKPSFCSQPGNQNKCAQLRAEKKRNPKCPSNLP